MKSLCFTILSFICINGLFAQNIHFSRTYSFPGSSLYTSGVVQKPDSGFVFVSGDIQTLAVPGFVFTETDKYGDTLYTRKYDFQDTTFYLGQANSLIAASDGNYVQCGIAYDPAYNSDGVVIKFAPNGDTLWMKIIGGDSSDKANSVYEDASGNYWVCGSTNSSGNGQYDFWLVVLDVNGNVQLDTTYGTYLNEDSRCGHFTLDGGFVMSGNRGGVPYVVKLDNAGNVEWSQTFSWHQGYGFVTQLPNASYVMTCCTTITNEDHLAFVYLDTLGVITAASYSGYPSYTEYPTAKPIVCSDGVVGVASRYPGQLAILVKMSPHGGLLWQRGYNMNSSSQGFSDIRQTSDRGFILAGSACQPGCNPWLLKVDSLGCETPYCDAVGLSAEENAGLVHVFPNPASGEVNFHFGTAHNNRVICLYDQFGREILRVESNEMFIRIDVDGFAEGLYSYIISDPDGYISNGKLVLSR